MSKPCSAYQRASFKSLRLQSYFFPNCSCLWGECRRNMAALKFGRRLKSPPINLLVLIYSFHIHVTYRTVNTKQPSITFLQIINLSSYLFWAAQSVGSHLFNTEPCKWLGVRAGGCLCIFDWGDVIGQPWILWLDDQRRAIFPKWPWPRGKMRRWDIWSDSYANTSMFM